MLGVVLHEHFKEAGIERFAGPKYLEVADCGPRRTWWSKTANTIGDGVSTTNDRDDAAVDLVMLARALSHPIRARILLALAEGERLSPARLSERFGEPLTTVAYHAQYLARRGLITLDGTVQRRGATEHRYVIAEDAVGAVLFEWQSAAI